MAAAAGVEKVTQVLIVQFYLGGHVGTTEEALRQELGSWLGVGNPFRSHRKLPVWQRLPLVFAH